MEDFRKYNTEEKIEKAIMEARKEVSELKKETSKNADISIYEEIGIDDAYARVTFLENMLNNKRLGLF